MSNSTTVRSFIENIVLKINKALQSRPHGEVCVCLRRAGSPREVKYTWPGNTASEAWRFGAPKYYRTGAFNSDECLACVLAVLIEIKTALQASIVVTKRDIYYRYPELFKRQEVVDRYIDDIAFTCGVSRPILNVAASPKALICGFILQSTDSSGAEEEYIQRQRVQVLPSDLKTISLDHIKHLLWIVVVEKEASFQTLVEKRFDTLSAAGRGLLLTAKGYPDLNSIIFLRHLVNMLSIPVYSLTDSDPDGLDIHRCFTAVPKSLCCDESIQKLAIRRLGIDMGSVLSNTNMMSRCILLTKRDRVKAIGMLDRAVRQVPESWMQRHLRTMLMLDKKMEIQAVDEGESGGLCRWLNRSLSCAMAAKS